MGETDCAYAHRPNVKCRCLSRDGESQSIRRAMIKRWLCKLFGAPLNWLRTASILWHEARSTDYLRLHSNAFEVFLALVRLHLRCRKESKRGLPSGAARARIRLLGFDIVGSSYAGLSYLFRDVMLSADYDPGPLDGRPVIIDIGANIGMSILFFKRLFPNSSVYAFEPNPHAFRLLQQNVFQNALKDVVLFDVALSRDDGRGTLYTSGEGGEATASLIEDRGGKRAIEVSIRRLSSLLPEIGPVDFLKMDCEGAEVAILEDLASAKALWRIPRLVVEYHHMLGEQPARLGYFLRALEAAGFDYFISAAQVPFASKRRFQDVLVRACHRQPPGPN
jgi:FkbM family methyltransferase